jgi:excinuclease ABC subunit C
VLTKKHVFYFPLPQTVSDDELMAEHMESYYRTFTPPATILANVDLGADADVYGTFFKTYHNKDYAVVVRYPDRGHDADLLRLGAVHAQQILDKQHSLPQALKALLKLANKPHTIDCFDISHKQGMFMVGSCVRFVDGQPDKKWFRHFHIKTVNQQDDYASLREIVARRYKDGNDVPDLILVDGGKGQLNAVSDLLPQAEFAALAKREETIFSKRMLKGKRLNQKSYAGQVLIALRDYAHHFALSFHRKTERKPSHASNEQVLGPLS